MSSHNALPAETRRRALAMTASGMTAREIGNRLGITPSVVQSWRGKAHAAKRRSITGIGVQLARLQTVQARWLR